MNGNKLNLQQGVTLLCPRKQGRGMGNRAGGGPSWTAQLPAASQAHNRPLPSCGAPCLPSSLVTRPSSEPITARLSDTSPRTQGTASATESVLGHPERTAALGRDHRKQLCRHRAVPLSHKLRARVGSGCLCPYRWKLTVQSDFQMETTSYRAGSRHHLR